MSRKLLNRCTVALYLFVLAPATVWLFPDNALWLSLLLLLVGFLDELKDFLETEDWGN